MQEPIIKKRGVVCLILRFEKKLHKSSHNKTYLSHLIASINKLATILPEITTKF